MKNIFKSPRYFAGTKFYKKYYNFVLYVKVLFNITKLAYVKLNFLQWTPLFLFYILLRYHQFWPVTVHKIAKLQRSNAVH